MDRAAGFNNRVKTADGIPLSGIVFPPIIPPVNWRLSPYGWGPWRKKTAGLTGADSALRKLCLQVMPSHAGRQGVCGGWWRGVRVAFAVLSVRVGLMPILARIAAGASRSSLLVFPCPPGGGEDRARARGVIADGSLPPLSPPPGGGVNLKVDHCPEGGRFLLRVPFGFNYGSLMVWVQILHPPRADSAPPPCRFCTPPVQILHPPRADSAPPPCRFCTPWQVSGRSLGKIAAGGHGPG